MSLRAGLVIANQELGSELASSLGGLPFRIQLQQSGVEDIDTFAAAIEAARLDVLFLDVTNLDRPAEQVIRRIKALAAAPMVIALGDKPDAEAILSSMRAGANEFLYPPFEAGLHKAAERLGAEKKKAQAAARQRGKVIGFLSAKGGCGATMIACHVAAEIERSTKADVLLADMDMDNGTVGFIMKAKSNYTVLDAAKNVHRMDQSYWKAVVSNGQGKLEVAIAPVMASIRELADPDAVRQVVRSVRSYYDWIVVDLGRGLNPVNLSMLDELDDIYLIATLDMPALHQAKLVIQALVDAGFGRNQLRLLMNRMPKRPDFAPDEVQKALGLPIFEMLPNDYPELYQAYAEGRLAGSASELGKALSGFAARITGSAQAEKPKQKSSLSLFQF